MFIGVLIVVLYRNLLLLLVVVRDTFLFGSLELLILFSAYSTLIYYLGSGAILNLCGLLYPHQQAFEWFKEPIVKRSVWSGVRLFFFVWYQYFILAVVIGIVLVFEFCLGACRVGV